ISDMEGRAHGVGGAAHTPSTHQEGKRPGMRVMFISHSSANDGFGGGELTLLNLIDRWRELRPEVDFFVVSRSPEGMMQAEFDTRGVSHRALPFDAWVLPMIRERPIDVIMTARMDSEAVSAIVGLIREYE